MERKRLEKEANELFATHSHTSSLGHEISSVCNLLVPAHARLSNYDRTEEVVPSHPSSRVLSRFTVFTPGLNINVGRCTAWNPKG
jgi:hypothetical protein